MNAVLNHLTPYTTGIPPSMTVPLTMPSIAVQSNPLASQGSGIAQPTPLYGHARSQMAPYPQAAIPSQVEQLESQVAPRTSPSPADDTNDAIQSQGFVETQYSPDQGGQSKMTAAHVNLVKVSDAAINSEGLNATSTSETIVKKRKLDAQQDSNAPKSSRATELTTSSTTFVSNLLDLSDSNTESSQSLGITHPPLDPYEGTPWGMLDHFVGRPPSASSATPQF